MAWLMMMLLSQVLTRHLNQFSNITGIWSFFNTLNTIISSNGFVWSKIALNNSCCHAYIVFIYTQSNTSSIFISYQWYTAIRIEHVLVIILIYTFTTISLICVPLISLKTPCCFVCNLIFSYFTFYCLLWLAKII